MINQVVANPDYTSTSNQYGFYALPKTVKPKPKYREENEDQEDDESNKDNAVTPLHQQAEDEKKLQRDYYVDEAPWPEYKKKQPGLDFGVQVEDEQLFDYERQVQPLLEILVGQSILKARSELQEQTECQEHQQKLSQFNKKRNAELMVTQRLQAQRKRKTQQTERRLLQHKVHKQQKKVLLKKIISHKQSKKALVNLRSEILYDLEQQGFLRSDPYLTLRTSFEPWLYEQIVDCLEEEHQTKKTVDILCNDKQKQLTKAHSIHIDKQNQRKKEILDQREKQQLENEQRKRKRAIKKHRKALNAVRIDRQDKIYGSVSKGQRVDNVHKSQLTDNAAKSKNSVYLSGGVCLHIAEVLDGLADVGVNISDEQVEDLFVRILTQLPAPVDIPIYAALKSKIKAAQALMRQNFNEFNDRKEELIQDILQSGEVINYQALKALGINLKKKSLQAIAKAVLSIYLTQQPPQQKPPSPKQPPAENAELAESQPENPVQLQIVLTEKEQQRLAVRQNVNLVFDENKPIPTPSEVIRIRFPLERPDQQQQQQQQPQDTQYIEIFDGEGWERLLKKNPKRRQLNGTQPRSYNFTGFERSFIYDEVVNYNFEQWLLSLLQKMNITINQEEFTNVMAKQNAAFERIGEALARNQPDSIAVYDFESEQ